MKDVNINSIFNESHSFDSPLNTSSHQSILTKQHKLLNSSSTLTGLIESMPEPAFILNTQREVVLHNSRAAMIAYDSSIDMIGKKIGEIINCVDAFDKPNNCGGGKLCGQCGMSRAFFTSIIDKTEAVEEVRVSVINKYNQTKTYNLKAYSRLINVEDEQFVVLFLQDISSDKRRETLEKIFFHDALNTAGALTELISSFSKSKDPETQQEMLESMFNSANQLLNELSAQRDLTHAEEGNLYLFQEKFSINFLLNYIYDLYIHSLLAKGVNFHYIPFEENISITTDKTLLSRSLGNLVKNALEASKEECDVKIFVTMGTDSVKLNVYNTKFIHESIQSQIFQRSFTTKGSAGRGLGTYSTKLIVEQYLKGKVYFTSEVNMGTTFTIELPLTKQEN